MTSKMTPLFIWAGGKNKMIPKYQATPSIPLSGYDTYVEPFFGGGAMMIYIYQNNPSVKKFVMNDVNTELMGLYRTIKNDVTAFLLALDKLCISYLKLSKSERKEFYYKIRHDYTQNYSNWSSTEESATLYFLMKTAFNGIWQSTKNSNGRFATPCGLLNHKKEVYDKNNVMKWHTFLQNVDIYCGDWKKCVNNISDKSFYFMDPPYRDSFTQYDQVFGDDKHLELIEFCKQADLRGDTVMYCNRDASDDFYLNNRDSLSIKYYPITYTAGRRKKNANGTYSAKVATEILLHSSSIESCIINDALTFGNGLFTEE